MTFKLFRFIVCAVAALIPTFFMLLVRPDIDVDILGVFYILVLHILVDPGHKGFFSE